MSEREDAMRADGLYAPDSASQCGLSDDFDFDVASSDGDGASADGDGASDSGSDALTGSIAQDEVIRFAGVNGTCE